MEILVTAAIIGYIIYLRYYADLRTKSEKDFDKLQVGIKLYTIGYTFFTSLPQTSGDRELEAFGLYGSIILTFAGSFIGGILKRQLIRYRTVYLP